MIPILRRGLWAARAIDLLIGGSAYDVLEGEGNNDILEGRGGDDELMGGVGDDTYRFGPGWQGWDWVFEHANEGTDTLDFVGSSLGVNVDLGSTGFQVVNNDLWFELLGNQGESAIEKVIGSNHADTIRGNSLPNELTGLNGADTLEGRRGDDILRGLASNDTYVFGPGGGLGHDSIFEPANADTDTLDFFNFGFTVGYEINLLGIVHALILSSTFRRSINPASST